jgi:hypothetical protein
MGFGLDLIYCTLYIHAVRDYRQYSDIAVLHTFQFTVAQALGFSVFTSRILATDLSQSHCNFNSHMKSSWYSLIPFLPFLQLPIPKTRLDYFRLLLYTPSRLLTVPSYNSSARILRKTSSSIVKNSFYWSVTYQWMSYCRVCVLREWTHHNILIQLLSSIFHRMILHFYSA